GQRTFLSHAGAAWKTGRRRADLEDHEQTPVLFRWGRSELLGNLRNAVDLHAPAHPENRRTTRSHERQAPLGGDRRLGERLRDGNAEPLCFLLLRSAPNDLQVGGRGSPT